MPPSSANPLGSVCSLALSKATCVMGRAKHCWSHSLGTFGRNSGKPTQLVHGWQATLAILKQDTFFSSLSPSLPPSLPPSPPSLWTDMLVGCSSGLSQVQVGHEPLPRLFRKSQGEAEAPQESPRLGAGDPGVKHQVYCVLF